VFIRKAVQQQPFQKTATPDYLGGIPPLYEKSIGPSSSSWLLRRKIPLPSKILPAVPGERKLHHGNIALPKLAGTVVLPRMGEDGEGAYGVLWKYYLGNCILGARNLGSKSCQ